jgi:hypothetical protein
MLTGTKILDLLHQKPGRYMQHDMGLYRMKEADGADVLHTEKSGRESPVEPLAAHMDGLMDEGRLVRDGPRYLCPSPKDMSGASIPALSTTCREEKQCGASTCTW